MRRNIGKNYRSISSMEKFSSSALCTCMKRKEANSIPSESWLDRVGERRTEVFGHPVIEAVFKLALSCSRSFDEEWESLWRGERRRGWTVRRGG